MKKSIAIIVALFMLMTNVGLTLGTHFCGGKAVSTALQFGMNDLGCGMEDLDTSCDNHSELPGFNAMACCSDEIVQIQVINEYENSAKVTLANNIVFQNAFLICSDLLIEDADILHAEYLDYSPPLLKQDIPILISSFLI